MNKLACIICGAGGILIGLGLRGIYDRFILTLHHV